MIECPNEDLLAAFVDGTASDATRRGLHEHVDDCDACRALLVAWASAFVAGEEPGVATLEAGTEIDRFVVDRELGRGARGIVLLAHDRMLGRAVVLKLAARRHDPCEHALVVAEGKALAALAHPNVVRVFDLGEWQGHVYIAMESIDAVDLRAWLRRRPAPEAIVRTLHDAASGLAALHRAGIVHRDVKPENVVVGASGGARVIDLDLAVRRDDGRHTRPLRALRVAGTPCYMAPEAIAGAPPHPSADVYAFCRMALEITTHPRPLRIVLESGLDLDPSKRPTMATIEAMLAGRPTRRRGVAVASVVALLGFAAVALACAGRPAEPAGGRPMTLPPPPGAEPPSTGTTREPEPAPMGAPAAVVAPPPAAELLGSPAARAKPIDPFAAHTATGIGRPFDRVAATRAVAGVDPRRCSAASGIPQRVIVDVVFRPRGEVERLFVMRGGSATACLDKLFRSVRVAPYVGGNERVDRTFTVVLPDDRSSAP